MNSLTNIRAPECGLAERSFYRVHAPERFYTAKTLNVDWLREFGATQHVRRVASIRVLNHHTIHREFRDLVAKRYCRESIVTA